MLHVALFAPTGLILAHAMLQVEHRIAFLGILLQVVFCRCIDHRVTPFLGGFREVVERANLTRGDTGLWTVVVALGTLRNLDTTRLTVTAEEGLCGGVDEVYAADVHEVIVETRYQRIGHAHPTALAVGLHVVLLATDVEHHLAGLGGLDAEIGATLTVDLGEFVAGDGGLCQHGILGHLDAPGHLDIGAHGLEAEVAGHGLAIATAQLTVAGSVEVETVGAVGTVVGRNDLCSMERLRQFVDLLLTADADPLTASLYDVTGIKVHLLRLQFQVAAEVVVNLLHHTGPLGIAGVCLTLVHQDAFDHTVLLCLLGERD